MSEVLYGTQELLGMAYSLPFWTLPVLGLLNMVVTTLIRRK